MQTLELYIEGQRVEMFKDESVSITQTIKNIKDIGKIFTEFSKTFTLPASKVNNKIFKHYYNFEIDGGFDARTKKSATLKLNHRDFKKGKIKLEGVDLKNNKAHIYRVTFFGEAVDLKDLLGEDKLEVLNLNIFDQVYSPDDIEDGLQRDASIYHTGTVVTVQTDRLNGSGFTDVVTGTLVYNLTTNQSTKVVFKLSSSTLILDDDIFQTAGDVYEVSNHILVPLITHTTRLYYNATEDLPSTGNLHWHGGGGTHVHGVSYKELKYALRISKIVDAIEDKYGLTFSNDFFTSTNANYFNLYMWLHRKSGNVESEISTTSYSYSVDGWTPLTRANTQMLNSSTLRIFNASIVTNLDLTLTKSIGDTASYNISVTRNGTQVYYESGIQATKTIDLTSTVPSFGTNVDYVVTLSYSTPPSFSDIEWAVDSTGVATTEYFNTGTYQPPSDIGFTITEQIPEMKVYDFLMGLFKMFNLVAFIENGTVYIDTLDNFYANKKSVSTAYDITEFVDINQSNANLALPYRQVNLGYEDTDSFLAREFSELNNRDWGRAQFTRTDDDGNIVDGEVYNLELPFAHFLYERLTDASDLTQTTIQWGWSVDEGRNAYKGKPLLFYPIFNQIQDGTTNEEISYVDAVGSDGSYTSHTDISGSINMPSNSVSFDDSVSDDNIHFQEELNEYDPDGDFEGTLFKNYYEDFIVDIFNTKRRLFKVSAYLPLRVILNLTLADRVDINKHRYKINSITTDFMTGKSELELLNEL